MTIDMYQALLADAKRHGENAVTLVQSKQRETVERLLEKRSYEQRTGKFTAGANRTARTLFDLIVWDLNT
jgi:predicted secreted Zn-dependent protease